MTSQIVWAALREGLVKCKTVGLWRMAPKTDLRFGEARWSPLHREDGGKNTLWRRDIICHQNVFGAIGLSSTSRYLASTVSLYKRLSHFTADFVWNEMCCKPGHVLLNRSEFRISDLLSKTWPGLPSDKICRKMRQLLIQAHGAGDSNSNNLIP